MSKFFDPKANNPSSNAVDEARLYAPATERNRDVICNVLQEHLDGLGGTLVEIASGTGQHAAHIAPHLPNIVWQPTDIETKHLHSIDAWRAHSGHSNIKPALHFNVIDDSFFELDTQQKICAVAAINLIHIAPWYAAECLIEKASQILPLNGVLFLYGPYKRGGEHTSQSNADFDVSLKSRNTAWGIRDMETVIEFAESTGFKSPDIIQMPANNLSLIFKKA